MKPIDRVVIVISALITFLLASTGVTAVYWSLGGSFKPGIGNIGFLVYAILELYLALVVINVARRRPGQIEAQRNK